MDRSGARGQGGSETSLSVGAMVRDEHREVKTDRDAGRAQRSDRTDKEEKTKEIGRRENKITRGMIVRSSFFLPEEIVLPNGYFKIIITSQVKTLVGLKTKDALMMKLYCAKHTPLCSFERLLSMGLYNRIVLGRESGPSTAHVMGTSM